MKAITLRNLPPEVAKTVQQRAKQKRTSVNKAVIELLEESVGGKAKKKEKTRYHDLDHLIGTWTKKEADEFEKLIAEQRTIDPELWK
jgi:plasmid stability protein